MMRNTLRVHAWIAAALLASGSLAGCGNLSRDVAADGSHAAELVWPAPGDTAKVREGGAFIVPAALREVHAGMTKDQIGALIGYPHFGEGAFGVREWNYLFKFRTPSGSDTITTCQYKILFDERRLARSFYWKPQSCADLVNPAPAVAKAEPPPAAPQAQTLVLSADALFDFGKFAVRDIRAPGRAKLDALAAKLAAQGSGASRVTVNGYTDRLGSAPYNMALSRRRAEAVRSYLVSQGVDSASVVAHGLGPVDPIVDCDKGTQAELIVCLAPNRRVVVTVTGAAQ